MKSIETEGKTVDQAIEIGLYKLGVTRDQVQISILEQAGLFNKAKVRLSLAGDNPAESEIKELAEKLISLMGLDVVVYVEEREDCFYLDITGSDAAIFIGKRGDNLQGFAYLLNTMANKGKHGSEYKRIVVDSNGYSGKREETLKVLAARTASKVVNTGRSVKLEPMNASERRIIHTALADHSKVTTISNGKEPYRYVTVILKEQMDRRKAKSEARKEEESQDFDGTAIQVDELRADND